MTAGGLCPASAWDILQHHGEPPRDLVTAPSLQRMKQCQSILAYSRLRLPTATPSRVGGDLQRRESGGRRMFLEGYGGAPRASLPPLATRNLDPGGPLTHVGGTCRSGLLPFYARFITVGSTECEPLMNWGVPPSQARVACCHGQSPETQRADPLGGRGLAQLHQPEVGGRNPYSTV